MATMHWVGGYWADPPEIGFLWTPGYWGYSGGFYVWHAGYWGPDVGFYGGVNYGFGYGGIGYYGGRWEGGPCTITLRLLMLIGRSFVTPTSIALTM